MSGSLQGKVAIVTGASKGIGAAIAKGLAAEGASVVVNYASSKAGADQVVAEIARPAARRSRCRATSSKAAEVKQLFAETDEAYGRLDILVNNAGVYQFAPLEDVTEAEFQRQFDTNVLGPILATQEAVKRFGDRGRQRHQRQLGGEHQGPARRDRLRRDQGRARPDHAQPRDRAGAEEDPASTRSPRAAWRPKARTPPASSAATSRSRWSPTRRSAASASRTTSPSVAVFLASDASRWITGERLRRRGRLALESRARPCAAVGRG